LLSLRNLEKVRKIALILSLLCIAGQSIGLAGQANIIKVDFYGETIEVPFSLSLSIAYNVPPSKETIRQFYDIANAQDYQPTINTLIAFKEKHQLNDWIYYQLIRKTAQQISPKAENYPRYTLYKWFLLNKSGFDANLAISTQGQLLFYVHCDENIYDIPYYMANDKQYVCLNKHDYANLSFEKNASYPVDVIIPEGQKAFSYKVTQMPDFTPADYTEKDLQFSYDNKQYHFKVMINPQVQTIFTNYPVVDYASYFNIPLSKETYSSLIPGLKKSVKDMKQKKGVDYLMNFTRHAFLYEDDLNNFGKEKRMSPEQTLLNKYSDCDDRAALFFYLVKEVYNLPMIAVLYPTHVTIAVKFDKPTGHTIEYKGQLYSVCEPTPQGQDLRIGQVSPSLKHMAYSIAYEYNPQ
jgi:hypothetical protein